MKRLESNAGVSLIELLIAVVILVLVAITIALIFPKASQSRLYDRQRLIATHLAQTKIEGILKEPYAYINVTPQTPASIWGTGNTNCNCNFAGLDMTNMPQASSTYDNGSDQTPAQDSIVYHRWVCITEVSKANGTNGVAAWTPICYTGGPNDTGLKVIRVQVRWTSGNQVTGVVDIESVASQS